MNSLKYIDLDVHSATTTIAVLDCEGKQIMDVTDETKAATLDDFLPGLRGPICLTLREGSFAASR